MVARQRCDFVCLNGLRSFVYLPEHCFLNNTIPNLVSFREAVPKELHLESRFGTYNVNPSAQQRTTHNQVTPAKSSTLLKAFAEYDLKWRQELGHTEGIRFRKLAKCSTRA
jgi:hypothetical protein